MLKINIKTSINKYIFEGVGTIVGTETKQNKQTKKNQKKQQQKKQQTNK